MKKIWSLLKKLGFAVTVVAGAIIITVFSIIFYPLSYVLMVLFQIPFVVFKGINTVTGAFWHSFGVAFKESAEGRRKKKPTIHTIAGTEHIH